MGEKWGDLSRQTEEAKKAAETQCLKDNNAPWKLKDAEIAFQVENDRKSAAARSWEEACKKQNVVLAVACDETKRKEADLAKALEANAALESQITDQGILF